MRTRSGRDYTQNSPESPYIYQCTSSSRDILQGIDLAHWCRGLVDRATANFISGNGTYILRVLHRYKTDTVIRHVLFPLENAISICEAVSYVEHQWISHARSSEIIAIGVIKTDRCFCQNCPDCFRYFQITTDFCFRWHTKVEYSNPFCDVRRCEYLFEEMISRPKRIILEDTLPMWV